MTMEWLSRTRRLIGDNGIDLLQNAHVTVFGAGGVGGAVLWALARAGVGKLTVVDFDSVSESNLNRQMLATVDTIGLPKTQAAERMLRAISPSITLTLFAEKADAASIPRLIDNADFVADAIDDVPAKLALIQHCQQSGIPLLCSMGTGNRLDPTRFRVTDIYKTSGDGLARVLRKKLRPLGITAQPVIWSDELPRDVPADENGRQTPASISFVPPAAGLVMASEIVRKLLERGMEHG